MPRATTVRLAAPLLPGRPRRIATFAEAVCRLGYAPMLRKSATWRTVPSAVHLPARCAILAGWHVGRGVPRPGRVSPTDALGCPSARPASRTTGFPDNGRSAAAYAELLRRAQDVPWTSGWPRRCRHTTAPTWESRYTHNQRITSAACLAALAAKGSAPRLAPRHYRIAATVVGTMQRRCDAMQQTGVVTGRSGPNATHSRHP